MNDTIRMIVNGAPVEARGVDPTTTLLDWLRYKRGLTGTKEGCAEGDCGACTVAVREIGPTGEAVQRTVNACIQLLPMLNGREIVTVEHLSRGGEAHPVQKAMSESHASQCGFCTPGIVMSLWHGYEVAAPTSAESVADQLAGNLCRCTGYGPILAAAVKARRMAAASSDRETAARRIETLTAPALDYEAAGVSFSAPRSSDELAQAVLANPDATILAGATDIGLWVTKHGFRPGAMIYLGDCADLKTIEETEEGLRFGAAVSHTEAMAALASLCPDFGELWRRFASPQVRSAGTLCGNIANGSPIGDAPPALIAAGATLTLRKGGERRTTPLEDFFVAYGEQDISPGEFVESVFVPRVARPGDLKIYKLSKRFDQDITAVLAAIDIHVEEGVVTEARIVYGGMAGTPKRAAGAEAALRGSPFGEDAMGEAMKALDEDFSPLDDHRASAAYRRKAARNLLLKYFLERNFGAQRVVGHDRGPSAETEAAR